MLSIRKDVLLQLPAIVAVKDSPSLILPMIHQGQHQNMKATRDMERSPETG